MKFLDDNNLARWVQRRTGPRAELHQARVLELALVSLRRINSFLDNVDTGDFVVYGDLEAYSCAFGCAWTP
jgi:hypothetical protein